ncbi:MAG TPA: hypothetical protein VKG91_00695 [Roseiarcus sp.]|nr:hypothetical protein [Roseiarcus sp.]
MRKTLIENRAAKDFARPAAARATSPTHRAQPEGGEIDLACRRGFSALDDPVSVEIDGRADSRGKVFTVPELPLSKVDLKYK